MSDPTPLSVTNQDSSRHRLRELGISIGVHSTGRHNAITDVRGVKVGHTTVKFGEGKLIPGKGPACTGVTAIIPHDGDIWQERVTAATFILNGNGCMTGLDWINEGTLLEGPIFLTNVLSVGTVYDAAISWMLERCRQMGIEEDTYAPVVGECDDSSLNDVRGRHVKEHHVLEALETASSGAVAEGAVGAGAGMISYWFKGGIGTSSRVLPASDGAYTVGVLVNCNQGDRPHLLVDGVPVGRAIEDLLPTEHRDGSICIVLATDAPLSSPQLNRLAKRAALGLARTGAIAKHGSGDYVVAFSTSRRVPRRTTERVIHLPEFHNEQLNPLFEAAAEATEEAVLNALFMADTTTGRSGNTAFALPIDRCLAILRQHGKQV